MALKLFIFNTPNTFSGVWTYLGLGVKAGIPCLLGTEGRFWLPGQGCGPKFMSGVRFTRLMSEMGSLILGKRNQISIGIFEPCNFGT